MTVVPYVTGRRRALERSVAVEMALAAGVDWGRLTKAERRLRIASAALAVQSWIDNGVLTDFEYEWRERG